MADITKCTGEGCPIKLECYRYKAKDSDRQSYFVNPPYNHKQKGCDMLWNYNSEWLFNELKRITNPTK